MDYLCHAEELAHFAQSIELGSGVVGREDVAAHVDTKRKKLRTCYGCGRIEHIQANCCFKGEDSTGKAMMARTAWF